MLVQRFRLQEKGPVIIPLPHVLCKAQMVATSRCLMLYILSRFFDSVWRESYTDVLFGGIRTPWAFSISASKKTS